MTSTPKAVRVELYADGVMGRRSRAAGDEAGCGN